MYTIREFDYSSEKDYEGFVAVKMAAWPDEPTTVAHCQHNDKTRNPKYLHMRYLVEDADGHIVAEGGTRESSWSYVPGKYGLSFDVIPALANQGIEQQLYDHILDFLSKRELKPKLLDSYTREDKSERINFWEEHGFKVIMRDNTSGLTVTDYDYTPYEGLEEKVVASGIRFATLPELQAEDPDWMQKMYDLFIPIDRDVPNPDEMTPQGIEEFAKDFAHPNFLADAHFFALDGDQWVGISNFWKDDVRTDKLWVGLTGVLRSHRRRGIARVLKLQTIKYAQEYGAKTIETENEENNPMYALNVSLGFKPLPGWLSFRKELT